jgi:uncharacterized membrane protein
MPADPAFLAEIKLFEQLDDDERLVLAQVVDHKKLKAGETLFHTGEPGDAMFIVHAGKVELFVKDTVGQKIVLKVTLEKIADFIAEFSGSMPFLIGNTLWFGCWLLFNALPGLPHFDPFPYGLLTMIVSLEAIFLSIFVLLSQNRQAAKDRVRADIEYEVNVKAELEVAHLHEKTDQIFEVMLERFARVEKSLASSQRKE